MTAGNEPTDEPGEGGNQDAADDDNGNMTLDFGFVPVFDLALTKELASAGPFAPGDDVTCLLYTSPSPRDRQKSRMPSSA